MVYRFMRGEGLANPFVVSGFVRHKTGLARHVVTDNGENLFADVVFQNAAARPAVFAVYKREYLHFMLEAALVIALAATAADKGFVRLYSRAARAERIERAFRHRLAEPG